MEIFERTEKIKHDRKGLSGVLLSLQNRQFRRCPNFERFKTFCLFEQKIHVYILFLRVLKHFLFKQI